MILKGKMRHRLLHLLHSMVGRFIDARQPQLNSYNARTRAANTSGRHLSSTLPMTPVKANPIRPRATNIGIDPPSQAKPSLSCRRGLVPVWTNKTPLPIKSPEKGFGSKIASASSLPGSTCNRRCERRCVPRSPRKRDVASGACPRVYVTAARKHPHVSRSTRPKEADRQRKYGSHASTRRTRPQTWTH